MKCLITVFVLCFQFWVADAQNKLSISGKTDAFENGDVVSISARYPFNTFFHYPAIADSSIITDGKFTLFINDANSELFDLSVMKKDGKEVRTRVFLQPSVTKIVMQDSLLKNEIISGNDAADNYMSFSKCIQQVKPPSIYYQLWKKYDSVKDQDPILGQMLFAKIDSIETIMGRHSELIALQWIHYHPHSFLDSYILYDYVQAYISDDSLRKIFYQLPVYVKKNSWGRELQYIINNAITGAQAPHFVQNDTSGNRLSLSDFTGKKKYIFLDFWASWCGPCREQNPSLRSVYTDFKNKNFTIIGISLDKSKQAWTNAIRKDSLDWPQVSDLKFWKNEIAKAYYVRSIPYNNFLIDPKGKIIARNLSMPGLRKKLSVLLQ